MNKENMKLDVDMSSVKEALINYIIPIICLTATAVLGLFVFLPSYKSLPKLKEDLQSKTTLRDFLDSKLKNLNRLVDFKSVVDENSKLVNTVLVSQASVPALLTQVDRVSRESGMTVTRLGYGAGGSSQENKDSPYNEIIVSLGVSGSYAQLQEMMKNVEKAARLLNIKDFRYSFMDAQTSGTISSDIVLSSPYMFVESSAVTDDAINLDISSPEFISLINKIKALKYYDPNEVNPVVPVVETPSASSSTTEGATPSPSPTVTPTPTPTLTPTPAQ